jgi:hypothetical protein
MTAPVIPEGPEWQGVRDIFETYHLDPKNPVHWATVVKALVKMSKKRAKAGAPKKWNDDRLVHLGVDFARIRHDHPKKSESDLCRLLAKQGKYRDLSWKTLRRKLYDSRNPARNGFLNTMLDDLMAEYEVEGGNTRESLLAWITRGSVYYWEDHLGEIHQTPPEPPPAGMPPDWPGHRAIRLVRK